MLKRLTIDDIYHAERKVNFDGTTYPDVIWMDEARFLLRKTDPKTQRTDWTKIDALSGAADAFYDVDQMQRALRRMDCVTDEDAARLARLPSYVMNSDR